MNKPHEFEKHYWNRCNDSDSMWIRLTNKGKASKELSVIYADSCVYHIQHVMSRSIDYCGKTEAITLLEKAEHYAKIAVALLEECKASDNGFALTALKTADSCVQAVYFFNMSISKASVKPSVELTHQANPEYKYQASIIRSLVPFSH